MGPTCCNTSFYIGHLGRKLNNVTRISTLNLVIGAPVLPPNAALASCISTSHILNKNQVSIILLIYNIMGPSMHDPHKGCRVITIPTFLFVQEICTNTNSSHCKYRKNRTHDCTSFGLVGVGAIICLQK